MRVSRGNSRTLSQLTHPVSLPTRYDLQVRPPVEFFDHTGSKVLAFFQKLPPCLVGIEACASSHHWSRELQALGHTVRLMPPAYVKP